MSIGVTQGAIFAFRDVTAQSKQAEAARIAQFSINQVPDLILQIGSDGLILEVNEATADILVSPRRASEQTRLRSELYPMNRSGHSSGNVPEKSACSRTETSYWTKDWGCPSG